jgi:hypothetical protein
VARRKKNNPPANLTAEQQAEAAEVARQCFIECNGDRRRTRKAVREKLLGMGWEQILVIVLPILWDLIQEWIKNRKSVAAVAALPPFTAIPASEPATNGTDEK